MKSISILVATYNQEKYIARLLDSILCQKEYGLNEIVVSDDCSKDNTFAIVTDYMERFPSIVKGHRNVSNFGIYGNFNHVIDLKGDSDFYYIIGGDDAFCDGYLKAFQSYSAVNSNDPRSIPEAFYSDFKFVDPCGKETLFSSKLVQTYPRDVLSMKIRGLIYSRSVLLSKALVDRFKPVDLSKGLSYAEEVYDARPQFYAKNNYYFPFVGSIYYSGIGVSTTLGVAYRQEDEEKWRLLATKFKDYVNSKDINYMRFRSYQGKFYKNPSINSLIKSFIFSLKGHDARYQHGYYKCLLSFGAMFRYYLFR